MTATTFGPTIPGLAIPEHNYVALSGYVGASPATVVYKQGGAGGTTVAPLTLTYDGSGNLLTVTRS